jgi:hypothetical protein
VTGPGKEQPFITTGPVMSKRLNGGMRLWLINKMTKAAKRLHAFPETSRKFQNQ